MQWLGQAVKSAFDRLRAGADNMERWGVEQHRGPGDWLCCDEPVCVLNRRLLVWELVKEQGMVNQLRADREARQRWIDDPEEYLDFLNEYWYEPIYERGQLYFQVMDILEDMCDNELKDWFHVEPKRRRQGDED